MKTGLVFSGGGSRGAYQVGVWKALNELDIKCDIVTGTSIGSINAAIYVLGDLDKAIELWKQISFKSVFEEELGVKMSKLGYLPELIEAVNQKDQGAKLMKSRVDNLSLKISEIGRKLGFWIQGKREPILDDKNAKRLFATISDLEYGLKRSREGAKYSLQEKEESIIDHKDTNGVGVLGDLREMIETEFEYDLPTRGGSASGGKTKYKHIKSQPELLALVYSPNPKIREAAYKALLKKQKENLDKFFAIYQGIVKDWKYEAKLRGYQSSIEVRNWGNHVPNKAIESLLQVCSEEVGIFQRYFKWKAKELRVKESDRIKSLCYNLNLLGLEVEEFDDGFIVSGRIRKSFLTFESFKDHRIAMTFAILSMLSENGGEVNDFECVNISNPKFEEQINSIVQ